MQCLTVIFTAAHRDVTYKIQVKPMEIVQHNLYPGVCTGVLFVQIKPPTLTVKPLYMVNNVILI